MSSSFWLSNYFASTNLGLESTTKWTKYEFDGFKFSKILSGDRFVFFVCSETNRLVEFAKAPRKVADSSKTIKIKKKSNVFNSLSMEKNTTQEVNDLELYYIIDLMGNPKKINYFMGGANIYLLEKSRIGVLDYIGNSSKFSIEDYSEFGGISKFFFGPLSTYHVVLTNDKRVIVNNVQVSLNTNESVDIIKLAACCGSGVVLASDRHLYARGENTFNVFSTINNTNSSTPFFDKIPFDFPSKIKDVKCGFFHTIVLLENNQIFACGYNTLSQCTFGFANTGSDADFKLIKLDFGIPKEIACSSRGTVVINTNNDVFMAGEVVSDFPESDLKLNPSLFKFNFSKFDMEEFNAISVGGWQYIIYHDRVDQTKDEQYLKRNLCTLLSTAALSDLVFIVELE